MEVGGREFERVERREEASGGRSLSVDIHVRGFLPRSFRRSRGSVFGKSCCPLNVETMEAW